MADSGPYTDPRYAITTNSEPMVSCPRSTCRPPTHKTSVVPRIVTAVIARENSDSSQVSRTRARIAPDARAAKRSCSYPSRAKLFTTRIAENVSYSRSESVDSSSFTLSARSPSGLV